MTLAIVTVHGRPLILPAATLPRHGQAGEGGGSASPSSAHLLAPSTSGGCQCQPTDPACGCGAVRWHEGGAA